MDTCQIKGNVLHVVNPEKAVNYKWEKDSNRLPSGLQIISIDYINSLKDSDRKRYFGLENICEDSVLIFEPYSKQYVSATKAEQMFLDQKYKVLADIASWLGASRISRKVETVEIEKRELDASGDISYKTVEASMETRNYNIENYNNKYETVIEYKFPQLTLDGFKKAEQICQESGLIYDSDFKFLLGQRNPNHSNPMKTWKKRIELSKELNEGLDIAFHLNVLKGVFSLNANVKEAISSYKKLEIETILEF